MKRSIQQKQVILAMGSHYMDRIHRGVAEYAGQHRWHLTNLFGDKPDRVRDRECDGIIACLAEDDALTEVIIRTDKPTVDLSIIRSNLNMPHITGENLEIGRAAARHFLERGFRSFAFYSDCCHPAAQRRLEGFRSALLERGYCCSVINSKQAFPEGDPGWNLLRNWIAESVSALTKPCAVYAYNDVLAEELISALMTQEVRVPDEVAVLGTDNHPLICPTAAVPISSINHDLEQVGRRAAEELDRLMNGEPMRRRIIEIPHRGITVRQSTDILAINDKETVRALQFMHANFNRNIGVEMIAEAADLSRRALERRFHQHLQTSVTKHLNRLRLDNVRRLLRETEQSISDIASISGYSSPEYLHRVFHRTFGKTPRQYRIAYRNGNDI